MQVDWNWFFAAYAQSGAALIGIISAFIISKLLSESDKYEKISYNLNNLKIKRNYYLDKISVYKFDWLDRQNIKYGPTLGKAIKKGEFENLSDSEKRKKLFEIDPSLFQTESCLDYLKERIIQSTPKDAPIDPNSSVDISKLNLPPEGLWDKVSQEKEKIIEIKIDCEFLIKEFEEVKRNLSKAKINLNPIKITIWLLSFGFVITVIYPLHFMPLAENTSPNISFSLKSIFENLLSIRGTLLVLMFIIIESIFIYFLLLLKGLERKYTASVNTIENSWLDIRKYSQHFECTVEEERNKKNNV
ncbi:MAG: hypothetical protein D3909_05255 [Candidatus Electrothrix sp. ATG1]|nr:hypothetical protein [Candidatus Electrothrix sp. ATG1]